MRWKVLYQFSRPLSLRTIVDLEQVRPNPALVDLERQKRLGLDLLLTYVVNPGTAFYLGYVDRFENLAIDPTTTPMLRRTDGSTLSTGRQLFVKASYLIRR
ncbi:MAG: hypothetical protein E6K81_12985 [Candidatus Eisenbacteria bacterium]|uniref:TonB-dependent receptor n=1 Tax=Eiseniibacteriota bacterium TaxID=2212470 RepID=A0A538U315_UNCEI|nr:MAG: hypothetical protein E6K81_12985 [Candidatus Eisenbacteria bacterium]